MGDEFCGCVSYGEDSAGGYSVGGDIDGLAVDLDVFVADDLSGLSPCFCESCSIGYVVETFFEKLS